MANLKNKTSSAIEHNFCIVMKLESWVDRARLLFQEIWKKHLPLTADRVTCLPHWRCALELLTRVSAIVVFKWSWSYLYEIGVEKEEEEERSFFVPAAILHFKCTPFIATQLAIVAAVNIHISDILPIRIKYNLIYSLLCYTFFMIKLYKSVRTNYAAHPVNLYNQWTHTQIWKKAISALLL